MYIYQKRIIALDALQLVALGEEIITYEREYPEEADFARPSMRFEIVGRTFPASNQMMSRLLRQQLQTTILTSINGKSPRESIMASVSEHMYIPITGTIKGGSHLN